MFIEKVFSFVLGASCRLVVAASAFCFCMLSNAFAIAQGVESSHVISLSKDPVSSLSISDNNSKVGWIKVDQDTIIGSYDEKWVEAFSLKTQEPIWWIKVDSELSTGAIRSIDNEYVFLAFIDGNVMKVRLSNGEIIWKTKLDSYLNHQMSLAKEGLICFSAEQKLYLLSYQDGSTKWIYDPSVVSDVVLSGASSPEVFGGLVFIGLSDGRVQCIDMSGALQWSIDGFEFNSQARFKDVIGQIYVSKNRIVFSRADGYVFCFDYSNQKQALVWKDKLPTVYTSKVSLKDPSKFIVSSNDNLFYYNLEDGSKTARAINGVVSNLYETHTFVFAVTDDGIIQAIKDDGSLAYIKDMQVSLGDTPFIYNGRIYFYSPHKILYGFEFIN